MKFQATLIFCFQPSKNVQAQTPGALWAVDRSTFRSIIVDSMIRKREHHEELLSNIKVFSTLTAENRAAIADCLVQETYEVSLTYQRHHRRAVMGVLFHHSCIGISEGAAIILPKDSRSQEISTKQPEQCNPAPVRRGDV